MWWGVAFEPCLGFQMAGQLVQGRPTPDLGQVTLTRVDRQGSASHGVPAAADRPGDGPGLSVTCGQLRQRHWLLPDRVVRISSTTSSGCSFLMVWRLGPLRSETR